MKKAKRNTAAKSNAKPRTPLRSALGPASNEQPAQENTPARVRFYNRRDMRAVK